MIALTVVVFLCGLFCGVAIAGLCAITGGGHDARALCDECVFGDDERVRR